MIKEDDKKKKKGMVVVIALGGKPPKSPEHTADPDDKKKMDDAWQFLKMKENTKAGNPFTNQMARMRAGKEVHEQTRMQMGNLEDPTADKEIKPPSLSAEVPAGGNFQGSKEEAESFEHGGEGTVMQRLEEEQRRKGEEQRKKEEEKKLNEDFFRTLYGKSPTDEW